MQHCLLSINRLILEDLKRSHLVKICGKRILKRENNMKRNKKASLKKMFFFPECGYTKR